ncbi:MAG TPA: FAD-dependent oxidoreductase [Rickettsiales bacterium]|nr:FAD-dependent oxidoreductase [Rickettsiales bacterium]
MADADGTQNSAISSGDAGGTAPRRRVVAVIGAGLSGLTSAYELTKQGYEVHIFDSKPRTGGKIHTLQLGARETDLADEGGEYIDSNQKRILAMADELGVKYIEANKTMASRYYTPNGKLISDEEFNKGYRLISEQVYQDSQIIQNDPAGKRAQQLDNMSVTQYLKELAGNIKDDRSWLQKLTFRPKPTVDPNILTMAAQGLAAERMRPASQMSALQFMHETANKEGDLIPSDCQYRIEGGTQRLTDALEASLRASGAHFHLGTQMTEIGKENGKFSLRFDKQDEKQVFDQVVLATQAHPIANIKGIEEFLPPDDIDTLQRLQYTNGTKITIGRKTPVENDGFFISHLGYEVWNRAPGESVFMIGSDLSEKYKPKELMKLVLEDYARAHNSTVDKEFDTQMVSYGGPDPKNVCYSSCSQGQYLKLRHLAQSFDQLAQQGLGIAGTYVPGEMHMEDRSESANRMGHGVESAYRTVALMAAQEVAQEQGVARGNDAIDREWQMANQPRGGWVERITQEQVPQLAGAGARGR